MFKKTPYLPARMSHPRIKSGAGSGTSSLRRTGATFGLALLVFLPLPPARAQEDGETLVQEAMCYACHQMDGASIGPPWQAIAARHAARKKLMVDVLAGKIVRGGGGNWGLIPMVPNQRVTEEEARVMAEWVLDQASD